MDWVQDMTARWLRIMSAAGGGTTPLDEAVHQVSMIGDISVKKGRFGRLKRNPAALAEASAVTVLCRQLIAGVVVSDLMIDRLCALAGQSREQVLDELSGDLPRQLQDQQLRGLAPRPPRSPHRPAHSKPVQGAGHVDQGGAHPDYSG